VRRMMDEMEKVDGVKYVLGLESVLGSLVPTEILPDSIRGILKSDKWELLLINSEYRVASDAVNAQVEDLNAILKRYDQNGMLIGEAPCMKDMIETTDRDFKVVNAVSVLAIFLIIALVGNALNFALNILGCFVHDMRLQCLEYFGRFYEDGGKPFRPLDLDTKYYKVVK